MNPLNPQGLKPCVFSCKEIIDIALNALLPGAAPAHKQNRLENQLVLGPRESGLVSNGMELAIPSRAPIVQVYGI